MDFNQLKGMFNGLMDNVTEKGRGAADKAKSAGRIAKLSLELGGEKDSLKKAFATLGETYYENKADLSEGLLAQLCEEIDSTKERIAAIEAEIAALKGELSSKEPDVEVTLEEVVEEAEQEAVTADEPTVAEEVIEKAAETVEEVKETVETVIEEIKDEE